MSDPNSNVHGGDNPGEPSSIALGGLGRVDSLEREARRVNGMEVEEHRNTNLPTAATVILAYQTIGVVYGDLGTSPLYVFSSVFSEIEPSKKDVLGVLSLILYTLTLVSLIKYVFIVLRANDNGNGGTFALYSLICRHAKIAAAQNQICEDEGTVSSFSLKTPSSTMRLSSYVKEKLQRSKVLRSLLLAMAILGTCMVIGDGVLTPSISVLSAIQGIRTAVPSIPQSVVVGVTCAILIALFWVQRFGTDKVSYLFSPLVLLWFISIALIGIYNIVKHDTSVFKALNPYYIYLFFKVNRKAAWVSLGGTVLCITGTEAMFADLGHFSVRAIQIAFTSIIYPCLMLAYTGQAAYLMQHPENVSETFYKSIPERVYWPMFTVATCASIIASQAMISATFSIVYQAMNLSCFPRVKVVHTSTKYAGQIYIPEMNFLLMSLCLLVACIFRKTSQIGNAYGVAVNADMVITTHLLSLVMVMIWQTPLWQALAFYSCLSFVEIMYFSSVLFKIPEGGWVPLVFVACFSIIMSTWYYGRTRKYEYELSNKVSLDWVIDLGSNLGMPTRIPGIGLVYTELAQDVPIIFRHLISKFPAMHSVVVFVCVKYLPVSHVPDEERLLLRRIGPNRFRMYRCAVRFGYNDVRGDAEYNDGSFESLLIQSLVSFLKDEFAARSQHEEGLGEDEFKCRVEINDLEEATELEEELAFLNAAMKSGIVYLLGHTEIRARKDSSWLKKVSLNWAFDILKKNCRPSSVALSVPHAKLLKVGMIHDL